MMNKKYIFRGLGWFVPYFLLFILSFIGILMLFVYRLFWLRIDFRIDILPDVLHDYSTLVKI